MPIVNISINLGFNAKPKFADRKFFADVTVKKMRNNCEKPGSHY